MFYMNVKKKKNNYKNYFVKQLVHNIHVSVCLTHVLI